MDLRFIQHLIRKDIRIFTSLQARQYAEEIGIDAHTIIVRLHRLQKKGLINRLMNGLYCLAPEFLSGIPIHEYEIATALVQPSCIAFLSAFSYHKLTDQMSSTIYVLALADPKKTRFRTSYMIRGVQYKIIHTKPEDYFGIEKQWIGLVQVPITDLERTLLDGITKPKYCGGLREVLDAYSQAIERINLTKIILYAEQISDAACKRLGWILSNLNVSESHLQPLHKRITPIFTKLDPTGPSLGVWNKTWYILENFL